MEELRAKPLMEEGKTLGRSASLKKLMLWSAAAVVLFEICLQLITTAVEKAGAGTGGLSGLQTRAILNTAGFVFQDIGMFLLPFWQIAVIRIAVCGHRGREVTGSELLSGFRRFGSVFGLELILGLILSVVLITVVQLAALVFTMTPMGAEASAFLNEHLLEAEDYAAALEQIPMDQLLAKLAPVLVLSALIGIPAVYLVWSRFRLAEYLVMDDHKGRAIPSMMESAFLMKGQFWAFLRLDLSLWWYYLLLALSMAIGFVPTLLAGKVDPNLLIYGSLALRSALSLVVAWTVRARVEGTYAAAYNKLWKTET